MQLASIAPPVLELSMLLIAHCPLLTSPVQGLQSAINVQLLQLCKPVLSSDEEDSVLSLPSLQRLYMPFCSKDMARSQEEEATVSKLQHSMHSGQTVSAEYLGGQFSSFVEAELAELQL